MNHAIANRKYTETKILEVRSLTTADLALLRERVTAAPVKTLRERHHHIAWLIALGKSNLEIAAECRMSPTRISQHKASPAFQELIARYTAEIESSRLTAARDFGARSAHNMALAEDLITRELTAAAEGTAQTPSLTTLNRIAADRMDRFGYGKHTTSTNINANFAANLEAAITRSRKLIPQ